MPLGHGHRRMSLKCMSPALYVLKHAAIIHHTLTDAISLAANSGDETRVDNAGGDETGGLP